MSIGLRTFLSFLLALPLLAHSQTATPAAGWLDSPQAKQFRDRVVLLALIHGESSGLDLQGYMVRTRAIGKPDGDCGDVEVVTLQGATEVRRETIRACKHPQPVAKTDRLTQSSQRVTENTE